MKGDFDLNGTKVGYKYMNLKSQLRAIIVLRMVLDAKKLRKIFKLFKVRFS